MGAYQAGRWPLKDESGQRYGCWEVVARAVSCNGARWQCRCIECGKVRTFYGYALRAGVVTPCKHLPAEPEAA